MALEDINAIIIRSPTGDEIALPLSADMDPSPYYIKNIEGLDPADGNLNMTELPEGGRAYTYGRVSGRRLVFTIGMDTSIDDGSTYRSLRNNLFSFFAIDAAYPATVYLVSDYGRHYNNVSGDHFLIYTPVANCTGYTVSINGNPFSSDPEVVMTIDCESAYFIDSTATRVYPTTPTFDLDNEGTVASPLYVEFVVPAAASFVSFRNQRYDQIALSRGAADFAAGSKITIDTTAGRRSITYQEPGGAKLNALGFIFLEPVWTKVLPGANTLTISCLAHHDTGLAASLDVTNVILEYRSQYLGL